MMDIYLSREALCGLSALNLDPGPHNRDGILLGHQRGPRIFIEKIFPSREGFFSSLEVYFRLAGHFEHELMGFYAFEPEQAKIRRILVPQVCGKVFLEVRPTEDGRLRFKSYRVDFEGEFRLNKIPLRRERHRR